MRSRPARNRLAATALAAAVLAGLASTSSAAVADPYPTCNTYKNVNGHKVPAYGQPTPTLTCNLVLNTSKSNEAVKVLQTSLNNCHHFSLAVDGYYGEKTFLAVRSVQAAYLGEAHADGYYGPRTRGAMKHWGLSGCGKI
ncbi:peptidoglycan-binding domain-containing protein [Streptomyces mayonensis]|uniref:peptidoglycan-binding domain-containing protein n=1 Tax=Streptomyces mayonensis TaxID=2750816 RepID=UPI001C1DE42D|nr:peptidoglycan-binding domain-containing protein [Streptomyces sp. A108]MBU6532869.1 peptidoglycan-binding protein [Streptomyces sp. A108]